MSGDFEDNIRVWLTGEGLEVRDRPDQRSDFHIMVRYPPTPHGHVFNIASPKQRNLIVVSTVAQVDAGQQEKMTEKSQAEGNSWEEWLHDSRLNLTRSGVDWVLHVRNSTESPSGPLQAFNLSKPIWGDGLSQNELMQTLRHLWLTKLALIHEIKYSFGPGVGKPGPVDDWQQQQGVQSLPPQKDNLVSTDDAGTFGNSFDPSEWQ